MLYWMFLPFKKYATFTGRSQRIEFWCFFLFIVIGTAVFTFVDRAAGTYDVKHDLGLFSGIFTLVTLVPTFAAGARRLHDIGKSGWLQLLLVIPLVGLIIVLVMMLQDSDPEENRYGQNPKGNIDQSK